MHWRFFLGWGEWVGVFGYTTSLGGRPVRRLLMLDAIGMRVEEVRY